MTDRSLYQLLSHLWLHEPDAAALARAREVPALAVALPDADDTTTLAAAYADLFLLNVYPYGTAYTDEWGELNTPDALHVAAQYEAHGYQPPELSGVGAPDHLGLCLGFVAHLKAPTLIPDPAKRGERSSRRGHTLPRNAGEEAVLPLSLQERGQGGEVESFLHTLLIWGPVCCLAAERDPSAHPFYCALAQVTREWLMADGLSQIAIRHQPSAISYQTEDELRLRDVVRFLLAPARCGIFLSRARLGQMANALGMRLPFGSRFEVCEWLFASAGEGERVRPLLQQLLDETAAWAAAYRAWTEHYPAWQPVAAQWLARIDATQNMLRAMDALTLRPPDLEFANPSEDASLSIG